MVSVCAAPVCDPAPHLAVDSRLVANQGSLVVVQLRAFVAAYLVIVFEQWAPIYSISHVICFADEGSPMRTHANQKNILLAAEAYF